MIRRFAIVLTALMLPAAAAHAATSRAVDARDLYESAVRHLATGTFDSRRIALGELEQATLLDPGAADYQLTLARAYLRAGHLKSARSRFERVTRLAPEDARARFGLGQVWRRDWLKYLDGASLDLATQNFSASARLDPSSTDAWLMLSALMVQKSRLLPAAAAAWNALEARPRSAAAMLAVASTAYRLGGIERADTLFRDAIPRLPREVRERFDDISPVASERDTMELHRLGLMGQQDFLRRFWRENDPDPATTENEAQLEYWSRVAQAYFLYYDARLRQWDERGEIYARYGPPESAEYNPIGWGNAVQFDRGTSFVGEFPANTLIWHYPALGMNVVMQDRLLSERYMLPVHLGEDPDPRPDPEALAKRDDALATHEARGIFPLLPPGARALRIRGSIARFAGEWGPRVLGAVAAPGAPLDSAWATWVVADSSALEVARAQRTLTPSACDPTALRVADFAGELPPGAYDVSISVRTRDGARGVYRERVRLERDAGELALSDILISCGPPDLGAVPVRPAPNPDRTVGEGDALNAYFEIRHLRTGSDGRARFEVLYSVRSAERDPRIWIQRVISPRAQVPSISATRSEENAGPLRRQFLSVPLRDLPPGRYWLEIHVRDLEAGSDAQGRGEFRVVER